MTCILFPITIMKMLIFIFRVIVQVSNNKFGCWPRLVIKSLGVFEYIASSKPTRMSLAPIISVTLSSTEKYCASSIQVLRQFNDGGTIADFLHSWIPQVAEIGIRHVSLVLTDIYSMNCINEYNITTYFIMSIAKSSFRHEFSNCLFHFYHSTTSLNKSDDVLQIRLFIVICQCVFVEVQFVQVKFQRVVCWLNGVWSRNVEHRWWVESILLLAWWDTWQNDRPDITHRISDSRALDVPRRRLFQWDRGIPLSYLLWRWHLRLMRWMALCFKRSAFDLWGRLLQIEMHLSWRPP